MKKLICMMLALLMVFSFAPMAFAADEPDYRPRPPKPQEYGIFVVEECDDEVGDYGYVSVKVNGETDDDAKENETVKVTASAKEGYEVEGIAVIKVEGDKELGLVTLNDKGEFKMPKCAVKVVVTFAVKEYNVTVAEGIVGGKVEVDKATAVKGDKVTITATAEEGYELVGVYAGRDVRINDKGEFIMPAHNVEVSAYFRATGHDVEVYVGFNGGGEAYAVPDENVVEGKKVEIFAEPEDGYRVKEIVAFSGYGWWDAVPVEIVDNVFVMPDDIVTVWVTFERIYDVVVVTDGNGNAKTDKVVAAAGEEVTVYTDPFYGYEVDEIIVTAADGTETVLEGNTFKMPAGEVRIIVNFKLKQYNVNFYVEGELYKTIVVEHGSDAELPEFVYTDAHPEEAYNQKSGWDNDGKNIVADRDIKAEYVINEYTVTWVARNKVVKTQVVKHGEDATAPAVPSRAMYEGEWDKDCKDITRDTVIYAVYTKIPETVTVVVDTIIPRDEEVEVNPNTGAPVMNVVPAMAVLCAVAYVCKKH